MNIVPDFIRRHIAHRPNLLKIVDNIGWLFFDKVLRMGVGLVVVVWIARYMGPQQFGIFNFATAFVGLFGAVAGIGLQAIVVRDLVRDPSRKNETLGTAAALLLMGGLLTYVLTICAIILIRPEDTLAKLLVTILGSVTLLKATDIVVYWFESQVLSKYTVWVQNGSFLVFAVVKITLILSDAPLLAFAWASSAEALLIAILLTAMYSKYGPGVLKLSATFSRAKSLLTDCWPLMLSGLAIVIYMKIDQIMLGLMLGDEAVGIYSAATQISEIWYFIPMIIMASVFPAIMDGKKQGEIIYYERLQRLYDLMVWLSVLIAIPMTFIAAPLVTLLYGNAYEEAGKVLAIHIWASVFVFLGVASSQWFIAENRQMLSFQRTLAGAITNIILNIILIPYLECQGAAIATVLSYSIVAFFFDFFQKETKSMFRMKLRALNMKSSLNNCLDQIKRKS